MSKLLFLAFLSLALLAPMNATRADDDPTSKPTSQPSMEAQLTAVFTDMKKGLEEKNEALFQSRWHDEGYKKNLVGGSGLTGKAVFKQGSRKGWYLKPELDKRKALGEGKVFIVPCQIWSTKKDRAVDKVWAAVIKGDKGWKILGAGEKTAEVEALVERFLKGEPLAPKKG